MGISIGSRSSYDCPKCRPYVIQNVQPPSQSQSRNPNPDPGNFSVLRTETVGQFIIVEVLYMGCTSYEGVKILVFETLNEDQIKSMNVMDPHFSESVPEWSPIARFVPTDKGWEMARSFANSMDDN